MQPRTPFFLFAIALCVLPAAAGIDGLRVERNENQPFLGVYIEEEVDHPEGGARVTKVIDGTAAEAAGLERGDVIVGLAGEPVRGPGGLGKQMDGHAAGDDVPLRILRDGAEEALRVTLGSHEPRTTVHLDRPYHVVSEDSRSRIHGKMVLDDDDDLDEFFVCEGDDCKFNPDPVWYRLDCVEDGCPTYSVSYWGRPILGVQVELLNAELREHFGADAGSGLLVAKVYEGSPAEMAGVEIGDLIVTIDGRSVAEPDDIQHALRDKAGETFDVEVVREGRSLDLEAEIAAYDR